MKTIESTIPAPVRPARILSGKSPVPLSRTAFFDIETTGLAPEASSIYLIGLLLYEPTQGCYHLTQWFADNYHSEKAILMEFLHALTGIERLCHFNGKAFDIPYLSKKCKRHQIKIPTPCQKLFEEADGIHSLDILREIRPLKKPLGLKQCNQTAVEHWLGIHRQDSFTGKELTLLYSEYMQKKLLNPPDSDKLLSLLLLHNHDDIAILPALCSLLNYKDYLGTENNPLLTEENLADMSIHYEEEEALLTLTLPLPTPLPREITLTGKYAASHKLTLAKEEACCQIPVYTGSLKYFLPNYSEYYYLPEEDTAIHKSIAGFVDSSHRKKATAATCFNRREGRFLPLFYCSQGKKSSPVLPVFRLEYKSYPAFCELPEDYQDNRAFWRDYLPLQLAGLLSNLLI